MQLAQFLKQEGIRRSAFAKAIGKSPSYVTGLCAGHFWPSRPVMLRIVLATGGAVRPDDFLDLDPQSDPAVLLPDAADAEGTPSSAFSPAVAPPPAAAGSARSPSETAP